MKPLCVGFVVAITSFVQAGVQNQTSIIGHWAVVKSDEAPVGSSVEFTKNGKLILTSKADGKTKKLEATYQLESKKLTVKRQEDGKDKTDVLTIQTLNDTTLITVNEKGKVEELTRKGK